MKGKKREMTIKRNDKLDYFRGIAVLLVLYGHSIQNCLGDAAFSNPIFKYIYSFHMPFFILLSGYSFGFIWNRPAKDILLKRNFLLFIPIVIWGSEVFLSKIFVMHTLNVQQFLGEGVKIGELFREFIFTITSEGVWFLYVVIFCNSICFIALHFLNARYSKEILFMCFIGLLVFCESFSFVSKIAYLFPYFVLGFIINKNTLLHSGRIINCIRILALLFPLLLLYYNFDSYIYFSGIGLFNSELPVIQHIIINLYRWLIGFSRCAFLYLFFNDFFLILNKSLKDLLTHMGKFSLEYYVMQKMIYRYIFIIIGYVSSIKIYNGIAINETFSTCIISILAAVLFIFVMEFLLHIIFKMPRIVPFLLFGRKR